jgi:hypothetical protein
MKRGSLFPYIPTTAFLNFLTQVEMFYLNQKFYTIVRRIMYITKYLILRIITSDCMHVLIGTLLIRVANESR